MHIKAFLSGIFRCALQLGYVDGSHSPVHNASISESAPEGPETYAYSQDEFLAMMRLVPEPGRTMIGTAWFTSLRRSEIRGLE
jgi:hypothetical protein